METEKIIPKPDFDFELLKKAKGFHIQKHTKKENTHDFDCPYCEGLKQSED